MNEVQQVDAMATAKRIAAAVEKKLVKYKTSVKEVKAADFSFIEISIRPPGGSVNDDLTVAYTHEYFSSATDETLKPKAIRILNDFRTLLGLPRSDK